MQSCLFVRGHHTKVLRFDFPRALGLLGTLHFYSTQRTAQRPQHNKGVVSLELDRGLDWNGGTAARFGLALRETLHSTHSDSPSRNYYTTQPKHNYRLKHNRRTRLDSATNVHSILKATKREINKSRRDAFEITTHRRLLTSSDIFSTRYICS